MLRDLILIKEHPLCVSVAFLMFVYFLSSILLLYIGLVVLSFQARNTVNKLASLQRQRRRIQKEVDRCSALIELCRSRIDEVFDQLDDDPPMRGVLIIRRSQII
jgi:cell division protein FtsL